VAGVIEMKGAVGTFILFFILKGLGTGFVNSNISPLVSLEREE
jgi:hypothetical protein